MKHFNKIRVLTTSLRIPEILSRVSQGELRVPNFQRGFVWKSKERLALFESIAAGYPIGNFIFWRAEQHYPSHPTIGPFQIPQEVAYYQKIISWMGISV